MGETQSFGGRMQSRGGGAGGGGSGRGPCSPPPLSRAAAANDGTLNAIVNNSVCSVDVPLANAGSHQEDEMLSWLHYPVSDSLDRGYCSDIFGDLPLPCAGASAHLARQAFGEAGERQSGRAASGYGRSISAAESCGSGPAEVGFRVAGADAVSGLGLCRPLCLESEARLRMSRGEQAEQPLCDSSSATNSLLCIPSESSQITSQQQDAPMDMIGACGLPMPAERYAPTNFALFARPAFQSKVNLRALSEGSGPSSANRVRQQAGDHVLYREVMSSCSTPADAEAAEPKWWRPPASLPPLLPLPRALPPQIPPLSSTAPDNRVPAVPAPGSLPLLPPSPTLLEPADELNCRKDAFSCSKMSAMSAEKQAHMTDQITTSPSRGSGSSAERTGIGTEDGKRMVQGAVDEVDYGSKTFCNDGGLQSMEEMAAAEKRSPSNAKRLRTAEMHNQSERRRRVKINDKLKTLQQLIPNGNKPDKASLLDAVIEYIKLLQSQLQMISMRTGIGIPPWMISNMNMQHLQMPSVAQMRLSPDMGMGMGVGLGMGPRMGVNLSEGKIPAVASGRTIMPMPLFPAPTALHPAERMQSPGLMNFVVGPSHIQYPYMSPNNPMYNGLPQQLQPQMQPQEQQFQTQSKQSSPS